MRQSLKGIQLRRLLVTFQFCASIILVVITLTIYNQVQFMRNYDAGVNLEQIIVVRGPVIHNSETQQSSRMEVLKDQIRQLPTVISTVTSSYVPGMEIEWTNGMKRIDIRDAVRNTMNISAIDYGFIDEYGIELLAGRSFSKSHPSDFEAILLSKKAASLLGFKNTEDAIGHRLAKGEDTLSVIGVFNDSYPLKLWI